METKNYKEKLMEKIREEKDGGQNFFTTLKGKLTLTLIAIIVILLGTVIGINSQVSGEKIAKNVHISNIDVGGLTKSEAKKKIADNFKMKDLTLKYENKSWNFKKDDAHLSFDLDKTVDEAYNVTRTNVFFGNLKKTIAADFGEKNYVNVAINYDKNFVKSKLEEIRKEVDKEYKNATVVTAESATQQGETALRENSDQQKKVDSGEQTKDDNSQEVDNIKDAAQIQKEEYGIKLNTEKSLKDIEKKLASERYETNIVVDKVKPKITSEDLKGIDTLLGEFSTTMSSGYPGRSRNIITAASTSSDVILNPGQEYSFNDLTGMRTLKNGYTYAPVIESGKLVTGVGGGVCQVSSTIYNAALNSGMEITVHRNHSIASDYVGRGRDATVTDSGQDFKFKNSLKHKVFVKNTVNGNVITSQIFGSKSDQQFIEIQTDTVGYSGAGAKTIPDPTLPAGKKVVESYGYTGSTVITYRIFKDKEGKVLKREKVATNVYPSKAGVVRIGTKKVAPVQPKPGQQAPGTNTPQPQQPQGQQRPIKAQQQ